MVTPDDLSKPPVAFDHDSTLVVVLEMSGRSWLAAAIVPGVDRRPLQKLPVDEHRLFQLLERWRGEARRHGKAISRVVLAHEAGRDGFWLARWLRARGVEVRVIHPRPASRCRAVRGMPRTAGRRPSLRHRDQWSRSARHRHADARPARLAARRAGLLPHGRDPLA